MTSLLRRQDAPGDVAARASARPATGVLRRRWGRIGVGLAAAVVGAWVFAALYRSADDRTEVVVAAGDLDRFEVLERSDLRVIEVGVDQAVGWVEADGLEDLVGRAVGAEVPAGVPLTESVLVAAGERLVAEDEAVVGIVVGPSDGPRGVLAPGVSVSVVSRPSDAGDGGSVVETSGWVLDVSDVAAEATGGERSIEVVVSRDEAGAVAAAAAEQRVSLVVVVGGR